MINIRKLTKAYFNVEGLDEYYEGYHDSRYRWNGWAMPCFTKEIADKIMQNIPNNSDNKCKITYDKDRNMYVVKFKDDKEEDTYKMMIRDTNEGEKQVYYIGSGCWVWEDYSLEEIERAKAYSNPIIVKEQNKNDKQYLIDMNY